MAVRVAINGFGRIGRNILRSIVEEGHKDIEVVAVNDLGPVETNAHLLRYDSVHGKFPHDVKVEGDVITAGNQKFKVTAVKDPAQLPHKELGVEMSWLKLLGDRGRFVGMHSFGASAPAEALYDFFGITPKAVVEAVAAQL